MKDTIIIIPSRLSATRLPNKPLLKINNKSLIMNVYERAISSKVGDVYVATCDKEIYQEVQSNGGNCVMTSRHHQSGTDRIFEAFQKIKLKNVGYIINLQGDEPLIGPLDIKKLAKVSISNNFDIGTLAYKIDKLSVYKNKNIVKVTTEKPLTLKQNSYAMEFSRKVNMIKNLNIYHHIGVYCYKSSILKKFSNLKKTINEKKNKLEQLRALDNNLKIGVLLSKSYSLGVDTKKDFLEIKKIMEYKV